MDTDKLEYDDGIISKQATQAVQIMANEGHIVIEEELKSARQIMHKVAGLARHVNDSPTLEAQFCELVDKDPELQGDMRALTRRVATRWNTDRAALDSHLHFQAPVQWMTGNSKYNLKKYALEDNQWSLAVEISSVLEIFQEPTDRFLQAEIPLIHETILEILTLRARLLDVRNDVLDQKLRPITRIAAQAALLVFDKYMGLMFESDVYDIAVIMSPDRKLKWFSDRGYDISPLHAQVSARFNTSYAPQHPECSADDTKKLAKASTNIWTQQHTSSSAAPRYPEDDSIEAYLASPLISSNLHLEKSPTQNEWN